MSGVGALGPDVGTPPAVLRAARTVAPAAAVVVLQLVAFPVPPGVWVEGLVIGLLGSLMAVGLALVFQLNRFVNFAQGDLGSTPAVLAYGLVGLSGVGYVVGLLTGLVGAIVLAAAVEILVIRRFTGSPRLVLTVATIGLSQALIVVSLLIPRLWGAQPLGTATVSFPWHLSLSVAPVVLSSDWLVAALVSVACLAGVAFWLRATDIGIAARASGDRYERAAMLGIPVRRIQTGVWVVAGALSYLSVFLKAAMLGLPLETTFSLIALVSALAALALGGFTDLPSVALSAVALGVLEQGVAWHVPQNALPVTFAVVAAVVLAAVLARPVVVRALRESQTGWSLSSGVRPLAPSVAGRSGVLATRLAGAGVLAASVATLPLWMGPGQLGQMATLFGLAVVGCSVVVLTGWTGQVTLGQMSFAAVGAVTGAVCVLQWHLDLSLAFLVSGAVAAVVAALVGIPTLRLDGVFVAVTTLAFGLAVSGYLLDRAEFSWIPAGSLGAVRVFGVTVASQTGVFLLAAAVLVLALGALSGLRHSRVSRVLRAVGTNPRAAAGYGVPVARVKLGGFALSGFLAGVAGCLLLVVNQQYVEAPYTVPESLAVFTATAVGGLGTATGAVVGAAVIEGSAVFLPPSWRLLPSALGVLVVLLAVPGGIASALFAVRDRLLGTEGVVPAVDEAHG